MSAVFSCYNALVKAMSLSFGRKRSLVWPLFQLLCFCSIVQICASFSFSSNSSIIIDENPLETHVVESHHDALRPILDAARRNVIPRSGKTTTLIHFDSHPDMSYPSTVYQSGWDWSSSAARFKEEITRLVAKNDIATHGVALPWAGLIHRLIWIHPSWSEQIQDFLVDVPITFGVRKGRSIPAAGGGPPKDMDVRWVTNSTLPYFQGSEYVDVRPVKKTHLYDLVTVQLRCMSIDDLLSGRSSIDLPPGETVILDVDLDHVATLDPHIDSMQHMFGAGVLKVVEAFNVRKMEDEVEGTYFPAKTMFEAGIQKQVARDALKRWKDMLKQHKRAAKDVVKMVKPKWLLEITNRFDTRAEYDHAVDTLFKFLLTLKSRQLDMIKEDPAVVLEDLDESGYVPHVPQSRNRTIFEGEIKKLGVILSRWWANGNAEIPRPSIVAMSRSVADGFLDKFIWPLVEHAVLDIFKEVFNNISVMYGDLEPLPKMWDNAFFDAAHPGDKTERKEMRRRVMKYIRATRKKFYKEQIRRE